MNVHSAHSLKLLIINWMWWDWNSQVSHTNYSLWHETWQYYMAKKWHGITHTLLVSVLWGCQKNSRVSFTSYCWCIVIETTSKEKMFQVTWHHSHSVGIKRQSCLQQDDILFKCLGKKNYFHSLPANGGEWWDHLMKKENYVTHFLLMMVGW